ncbi:MAG: aldehyde dehydrogenase family protein [Planctomycetota bacterium]
MPDRHRNFIHGEWRDARSGLTFPDINPSDTDDLIGFFPQSGPEDVDDAVTAAANALPAWRRTPAPKRAELMFRVGEIMTRRKEELSRLMTREMGKVLSEARGDVQEAIDTAYHIAGEGRRLHGITTPSELPDKWAMTIRQPIGVAGLITPWNFPIAIPTWKSFPALVAGCTVVLKPAEDTPLCATELVRVFHEAGFPAGTVNLVHGGGPDVGAPLVRHKDVGVVSFTGSSEVGRQIAESCGRALKRCSLEMGGKNAQIVLEDADLDLAIQGSLWGAFATTGQRCTATSRIIVQRSIHDRYVERLAAEAARVRIGYGLEDGIQMGPLINEGQRTTVAKYVDIGKAEGARLVCGGAAYREGRCARGFFFQPTVFDRVTPSMRIAREEIFGPVASVIAVDDLDQAIQVLNGTSYGLSSSIYTRDVAGAFRAMSEIECGIVYVNGPTIGAETHLPFGGWKDTGNGHREGGVSAFQAFTEEKTIYVDYSGRLQRAQIDNQPALESRP